MIFQFVKTNILSKKLKNFLTIFAIMISLLLIICIQNISNQLVNNVENQTKEYDLIVGKTGSGIGLALNSIFFYGVPEGNIDISYYESLQHNKYVKKVVPVGMGDSYRNHKIIGTTSEYFSGDLFNLAEGRYIEDEFEVVLGSTIAKQGGLKIGDKFKSTHGFSEQAELDEDEGEEHHHHDSDYTVVGILEPTNTPNDTVLFTTIETLWHVHGLHHDEDESGEHVHDEEHEHEEEHEEEDHDHEEEEEQEVVHSHGQGGSKEEEQDSTALITSLLIRAKDMSSQTMLYNDLSKDEKIQTIIPNQALREFLNYIKIFTVVITLIASVSVVISIIMLFITMLTSSIEQRKDTSILRALGASRGTIFKINICQMLILALIGVVLGFILSHIIIGIIGGYIATNYGLFMSGLVFQKEEIIAILVTILLSLIAGIIPALMVYKTDATKYLK